MARIFFTLSGKTDNLVFVSRNGKTFARSLPAKVKQTAATKERSRNFGLASAAGKALRSQLQGVLLQPKDRSMQVRFAGAIARWLALSNPSALPPQTGLQYISSFSFSEKTGFQQRFHVPMVINQQNEHTLSIDLPAFAPSKDIAAPAYTIALKLVMAVAGCNLLSGNPTGSATQSMELAYNEEPVAAQTLLFNLPLLPGSLIITAASLQYTMSDNTVCNKPAFMPCSVIDAFYR